MKKGLIFPAIWVQPAGNRYLALAGIRILSIMSPRLRDVKNNETNHVTMRHCELLQSLVAWPEHIQLMFNIVSRPAARNPSEGKIDLSILLLAKAGQKREAMTEVLARFGVLLSLLNNYMPEVEFEPVLENEGLDTYLQPFVPEDIVRFTRKTQKLEVIEGDDATSPINKTSLGFLASSGSPSAAQSGQNTIDYLFPWHPGLASDLSEVAEAMLGFPSPLWLQVRLAHCLPAENLQESYLKKIMFCEKLLIGETYGKGLLSLQVAALRQLLTQRYQQLKGNTFGGGVYLCSVTPLDEAIIATIGRGINRESLAGQVGDSLIGGFSHQKIDPEQFLDLDYFPADEPLLPEEAACAFRIPQPQSLHCTGLPIKHFRTTLADQMLMAAEGKKTISIGHSEHRGQTREVFLAEEDRLRHTCILGQTCTGKSTLLEAMVLQDIEAGRGICLIDPHGDLVRNVLNRYPEHRKDDLVLLDFADPQWVIPFNLLVCHSPEDRDLIIDDLYCWLHSTYDMKVVGGPMFEQMFRSFLRMLMVDRSKHCFVPTLLDFPRLFLNEKFRKFCKDTLDDQHLLDMIAHNEKTTGETGFNNMIPYVNSKLNLFELDAGLLRMVKQEEMAIDFQAVMDEGKVVLVTMGGAFGPTIRGVLSSQIVNRFQIALERRKALPPDKRRIFYLYIDEFQNIVSDKIINMFSEARKYRLGVVVANQFMDQLTKKVDSDNGPSALNAILGNVGTSLCFRLGIKDAERMEQSFLPTFSKEDLIRLPLGACYVNLKSGNHPPTTFSLQTPYSPVPFDEKKVNRLRQTALAKYAIKKADAEENIIRHDKYLLTLRAH